MQGVGKDRLPCFTEGREGTPLTLLFEVCELSLADQLSLHGRTLG